MIITWKIQERQKRETMADLEEVEAEESEIQFENSLSSNLIALSDGGRGQPAPQVSGAMHSLIAQVPACHFELAEYFVAWQGVLTVAFSGIPPPLCRLKQNISEQLDGIARENPGSKWPKISLGCLRDGKTLSLEQLHKLRQLCSEESPSLAETAPVLVDNLSVVLYANCCLEKTITVATTALSFPADLSRPTSEESDFVKGVLNEFASENIERYHTFTSKAGNRSTHYKDWKMGATVVHFVKNVHPTLAGFKARVDSELPELYDWFRDDSLHITIRTLF